MNKLLFCVFAFSALMLSSCSEEDIISDALGDNTVSEEGTDKSDTPESDQPATEVTMVTFSAALEQKEQGEGSSQSNASSRTTVEISGGQGIIKWYYNDAISVVNTNNTFDTFTIASGANTTLATFEGSFTEGTTGGNIAVYPAGAHTYDGTTLTVNLPAVYGDTNTPYTPNTNVPMIAQKIGDENELYFKHLGGVFYFDVEVPAGATSVSLTAKGISGNFTVDMSGADAVITQAANAGMKTVTYRFKAFDETKTERFYFPVPTGEYKDFTVTVSGTQGVAKEPINKSTSRTFGRTTIAKLTNTLSNLVLDHEWVDLGIGTLWATCNIGADSPTDYGNYYAWGAVTPSSSGYTWANYRYCNGNSQSELTKYVPQDKADNYGYNKFYDNLTQLESADDAARHNWGDNWRMPTYDECSILLASSQVSSTITYNYNGTGVAGVIIQGKGDYSSNSIFLPFAGYKSTQSLAEVGNSARYWSSTLYSSTPYEASLLYVFHSGTYQMAHYGRCNGSPIRPVRVSQ